MRQKERRIAARTKAQQERAKAREGMARGDERYLPVEIGDPSASSFATTSTRAPWPVLRPGCGRCPPARPHAGYAPAGIRHAGLDADHRLRCRRHHDHAVPDERSRLKAQWPDKADEGRQPYAVMRGLQIRRLRVPPPQFKAGGRRWNQKQLHRSFRCHRDTDVAGLPPQHPEESQCSTADSGRSGLMVSDFAHGNWIRMHLRWRMPPRSRASTRHWTRASQRSTLPTSRRNRGRTGHGARPSRPSAGRAEIFTKVFWPTGPGRNDRGLSRKPSSSRAMGLCADLVSTTSTLSSPPIRPQHSTGRDAARIRRSGSAAADCCTSGCRNGEPKRSRPQSRSQTTWASTASCRTSLSTRCCGASLMPKSFPTSTAHGIGQIVWSPLAQGVLTGKVQSQASPTRRRLAQPHLGNKLHFQMAARRRVEAVAGIPGRSPLLKASPLPNSPSRGCCKNKAVSAAIIGASRPSKSPAQTSRPSASRSTPTSWPRSTGVVGNVIITDPAYKITTGATMTWKWQFLDANGCFVTVPDDLADQSRSHSQADAETWIGENW